MVRKHRMFGINLVESIKLNKNKNKRIKETDTFFGVSVSFGC